MPTPKRYPDNAARQRAYRDRQAHARDEERRAKGLPPAPAIPTMPAERRWNTQILHARIALETAREEMGAYYADRSETWQEDGRGGDLLARMESIDGLLDQMDDLLP